MENWIRLHHVVARLLTPNELNIELSCVVFYFDLESSLERNVISYFCIRSCLIVYGFCTVTKAASGKSVEVVGLFKNYDYHHVGVVSLIFKLG